MSLYGFYNCFKVGVVEVEFCEMIVHIMNAAVIEF